MGRTVSKIKVENLADFLLAERGDLLPSEVRMVETDALVDTGATLLCLPAKVIEELGLSLLSTRIANTAAGPVERRIFRGAQLTILDRTCTMDVMELEDGVPALVGYIPLENLDLQPDPQKKALVPTPEHGDKMVMDLFYCLGNYISHDR